MTLEPSLILLPVEVAQIYYKQLRWHMTNKTRGGDKKGTLRGTDLREVIKHV